MAKHVLPPIKVKHLDTDAINRVLDLDLAPGRARMSAGVHEKVAKKHANDYRIVLRYLDACCASPTYVGQHPKHPGKVELILAVDEGGSQVLVSVAMERDQRGDYAIASAYCVPEEDVERWLRAGSLKEVALAPQPPQP